MKTKNETILIGFLLKAESMTPLWLLLQTGAHEEAFIGTATALGLAFALSGIHQTMSVWKTVICAGCLTTLTIYAELFWLSKIGKLTGPIYHYGIHQFSLCFGILFLGLGCALASACSYTRSKT